MVDISNLTGLTTSLTGLTTSLTGLKRNTEDKFYTSKQTVNACYKDIKSNISIKNTDLIIEPSAGNGAFIPIIKKLSNNYILYDIKPENKEIIKKDFLKLKNPKSSSKIHVIGNPPFGRKSSLAIKFIKKSCEFCDTISFILPKSFKKDSMKKSFALNFHLKFEKDLPYNSFIIGTTSYNVPCVFQIWIKKNKNRQKPTKETSKYFIFCKKIDSPDIAIRRVGINAGKVYQNDLQDKNSNSHYFIKIIKNRSIIINNKYNIFNNTVGPKSIGRQELIKFYNTF
jgi:hypothetical protein